MTLDLVSQFDNLNTWQRRNERAPHKPLLALWAIGRCLRGQERLAEFDVVYKELGLLLQRFGPHRRSHKPHIPFWRLQNDNLWEVTEAHKVRLDANGAGSLASLRELGVRGGFPVHVYDDFRNDAVLALKIARRLLDAHFPENRRSKVLKDTLKDYAPAAESLFSEIDRCEHAPYLKEILNRRILDDRFRRMVLEKYEFSCAVCNHSFEFPVGYWPALEAAHIKWRSFRGPDDPSNGISLCVLHRELFDRGFYTIEPSSLQMRVARNVLEGVPGNPLSHLHRAQLRRIPGRSKDRPAEEYLAWHGREVFRDA